MSGEIAGDSVASREASRINSEWKFKDHNSKLMALGVHNRDASNLDAIIASRHARKPEIVSRLGLGANDVVLDLGSGLGYIAEVIAPEVRDLHCCDISTTFLDDCRNRLQGYNNVACHKIDYADLGCVYEKGINKAYSTLLFIHFNFYDILFYLREINKVLIEGGLLYFDYMDGERYKLDNQGDSFQEHVALYKENRDTWVFGCMHMTSASILSNLAPQLGFSVVANWQAETSFSQMLLKKVGDPVS